MGVKLKERIGFKRAAVAVARQLAVVMHAMLRSGQLFDRTAGVAASAAPGEGVRLRTLTGRPCRNVGRIIPLDGVHRLAITHIFKPAAGAIISPPINFLAWWPCCVIGGVQA